MGAGYLKPISEARGEISNDNSAAELHPKLSLYSANSVLILYRIGNMQSAILLSFVASSSLPSCGLQSTRPLMPYYISPHIVNNAYDHSIIRYQ